MRVGAIRLLDEAGTHRSGSQIFAQRRRNPRPLGRGGCQGEDDHVHLLVNYPPKVAVSKLVNSLKGISSLMIWKKNIRAFKRNYGEALCGRLVTSLEAEAVRLSLLFASTSRHSKRRIKSKVQGKEGFAFRAYIPALKGEVLRANRINSGLTYLAIRKNG